MPNKANITAPITLVGPGRSGTTLVTAAFRRHPDFQALGETANVIYSAYHYMEKGLPLCGPDFDESNAPILARRAMRKAILSMFPSEQPFWFHKPIMTPHVAGLYPSFDAFCDWYWEVNADLFPDGKFFTVVRDWSDVTRSSMARWGYSEAQAVQGQTRIYRLLLHPKSRVSLGVRFESLVADSERELRRLFEAMGLEFHPDTLGALNRLHAPNPAGAEKEKLDEARARGFTHDRGEGLKGAEELADLHAQMLARFCQ